ncbi:hypothetical protein GCM10023183_23160 [Nibribacter koreensis]|uniref:Uncharacterized protein n=1 Tax=Nibribacter koreensis TaxID=1084519 RepID=A0ABP8FMM9_9BACT
MIAIGITMLANIEPALPSFFCTGFAVAGALFFSIVSKNLGLVVLCYCELLKFSVTKNAHKRYCPLFVFKLLNIACLFMSNINTSLGILMQIIKYSGEKH